MFENFSSDIIQTMKCFPLENFNWSCQVENTKINSQLNFNPGLPLIGFWTTLHWSTLEMNFIFLHTMYYSLYYYCYCYFQEHFFDIIRMIHFMHFYFRDRKENVEKWSGGFVQRRLHYSLFAITKSSREQPWQLWLNSTALRCF